MNLNERMNQLIAENERLKAELTTANSMHVDAVRYIWEQRGFGCCDEMAEKFDALVARSKAMRKQLEYFVSESFEWNDPHDSMIDDIHRLLDATPQHHLASHDAEVAAKAILEFSATLLVNEKIDVIYFAKSEADEIRTKAGKP